MWYHLLLDNICPTWGMELLIMKGRQGLVVTRVSCTTANICIQHFSGSNLWYTDACLSNVHTQTMNTLSTQINVMRMNTSFSPHK